MFKIKIRGVPMLAYTLPLALFLFVGIKPHNAHPLRPLPSWLSGNPIIVQEAYFPKLVSIFAAVLNTTFLPATTPVCKRMTVVLKHLQVCAIEATDCVCMRLRLQKHTRLYLFIAAIDVHVSS